MFDKSVVINNFDLVSLFIIRYYFIALSATLKGVYLVNFGIVAYKYMEAAPHVLRVPCKSRSDHLLAGCYLLTLLSSSLQPYRCIHQS